jgi:hypothetical protein
MDGDDSPTAQQSHDITVFLDALIRVKQALYSQFLDTTENTHEQNVNIIVNDYPEYLRKWADELCKGPGNIPPPAAVASDFLISALGALKAAMETLIVHEGPGAQITCNYYIRSFLVTYPYTMNTNSLS